MAHDLLIPGICTIRVGNDEQEILVPCPARRVVPDNVLKIAVDNSCELGTVLHVAEGTELGYQGGGEVDMTNTRGKRILLDNGEYDDGPGLQAEADVRFRSCPVVGYRVPAHDLGREGGQYHTRRRRLR